MYGYEPGVCTGYVPGYVHVPGYTIPGTPCLYTMPVTMSVHGLTSASYTNGPLGSEALRHIWQGGLAEVFPVLDIDLRHVSGGCYRVEACTR